MKIKYTDEKKRTIGDAVAGIPFRFVKSFHQDKDKDGPWMKIKHQYRPDKKSEHCCAINLETGQSSWVINNKEIVLLDACVVVNGDK